MKYLKLFENFDGEDPKWILTSALDPIVVDEVTFDEKYKDTSMFRLFQLSEFPTQEKLDHLESWLEDEGYYSTIKNNKVIVTEKPLEEAYVDWLKANYSGMKAVGSKELFLGRRVLYRYEPGDNILVYDKDSLVVSVRWDLIWSFFTSNFGMKSKGIGAVVEDWLDEAYGLVAVTTEVFHVGTKIATCL